MRNCAGVATAAAAAAVACFSQVQAYPYNKQCGQFPTSSFFAMGGTWTYDSESADISSSGNQVTFTVPSCSGLFVTTTAGTLATSSFTIQSPANSAGCPSGDRDTIATSYTSISAQDIVVDVEGLVLSNCGSVEVALGYSTGYTSGTILHKTVDLCTAETPVSTTTTTTTTSTTTTTTDPLATTTTTAATATTTTTSASSSDDFGYQFEDDAFSAFWYVFGDNIKIMWDVDFSEQSYGVTGTFTGIGFGGSASSMGPGFFYIGLSDSLEVLSRELDSGSTYPTAATDTSVIDSGCEVQGSRLYCFVLRAIDGTGDGGQNPNLSESVELMWAFGEAESDGSFGTDSSHTVYHGSSRGRSQDAVVLTDSAPPTPSLDSGGVSAFWSPTPAGDFDIHMSAASGGDDVWVGIGFGAASSAMGPGEFYLGDASNGVTNRYLASGNSLPSVKSTSNILNSDCADDGTTLTCSVSRPLADGSSDAESLESGTFFVRVASGSVSGTSISQHSVSTRAMSESAVELFSVSTEPLEAGGGDTVLFQLHGILMAVTWLVLLPFGIFVARFRDAVGFGVSSKTATRPPLWWVIHQPMQYTGVVLMLVAIIVIFIRAGPMTAEYLATTHSRGAHEIIGITSFALTLCQPVFAFCRNGINEKDEQKRDSCHKTWHIIHAICGYLALILALVAVALGITEYRLTDDWPTLFIAGFIISVASLLIFAIVSIVLLIQSARTKEKVSNAGDAEAQTAKKEAPPAKKPPSVVAYILLGLLLVGGVLCAVSIGLETRG